MRVTGVAQDQPASIGDSRPKSVINGKRFTSEVWHAEAEADGVAPRRSPTARLRLATGRMTMAFETPMLRT